MAKTPTRDIRAADITSIGYKVDINMTGGWTISFDPEKVSSLKNLTIEDFAEMKITDDGRVLESAENDLRLKVEELFVEVVGASVLRSMVARLNGRVKSEKRAAASRANGLLGGDPKKRPAKKH